METCATRQLGFKAITFGCLLEKSVSAGSEGRGGLLNHRGNTDAMGWMSTLILGGESVDASWNEKP